MSQSVFLPLANLVLVFFAFKSDRFFLHTFWAQDICVCVGREGGVTESMGDTLPAHNSGSWTWSGHGSQQPTAAVAGKILLSPRLEHGQSGWSLQGI